MNAYVSDNHSIHPLSQEQEGQLRCCVENDLEGMVHHVVKTGQIAAKSLFSCICISSQ